MLFRALLISKAEPHIVRTLAKMIEDRLMRLNEQPDDHFIAATGIAAGQIAMLRMWLSGEAACSVQSFIDQFLTVSKETS